MKRRAFMRFMAGSAAAWPLGAPAQEAKKTRIGVLVIGNADAPAFGSELRQGLRELGRNEGQHYVLEFRSAEGQLDRLPQLASELVQLKVGVLIALFTPCALAAKQATREIPIVIVTGDPLGTGLVESLSRPGGNITGLSQMGAETHGKCVEIFRDMLPTARRVALMVNGADPVFARSFLEQARLASARSPEQIGPIVTIGAAHELDAAFETVVKASADALVFQASLPTKRMAELALQHRLPAATIIRAFAEIGGLMSYGSDGPALFRRTATFVHKILAGEMPANIPVEQATKFNLVINNKTAKALGLEIPATLLARADEVIE